MLKKESIDTKAIAGNQCLIFATPKTWFVVGEIDAPKRLFEVKRPGLTIQAKPVPVKDTIGCVAVLLNFKEEIAGINGVEPTARDKYKIVLLAWDPMQQIRNSTALQG